MNNVQLLGRLTRDVELKESKTKNKKYGVFTLAVGNGENAIFVDCYAFDKLAETIEKYVKKGNRLLVEGSLNISSYADKDGNNRKNTSIMVNKIHFIESAKKENKENTKATIDIPEDLPF